MADCRLTALLVYLFVLTGGSQGFTIVTEKSNLDVPIGRDAVFTVRPSSAISGGNWVFKSKTIAQWIEIGASYPDDYKSRGDLNLTTGSLTLKSVNESDNGDYTVSVTEVGSGAKATAIITLKALERVANVNLRSNNSEPVEQRDSVVLTCNSQGSQLKREWFFNDQPLQQNDRINISGNTLIIDPVNRADAGMYKCIVSNGLNSDSAETTLKVLYGPDNMEITPKSPVTITNGKDLTLNCSAQSVPSPVYEWFNETESVGKGPVFTIPSVSKEHAGKYTCHANNTWTGRNTSLTVNVNVKRVTGGLGPGAIVGIVIGIAVVVAIVLCGLICCFRKKCMNRSKSGTPSNDPKMSSSGNIPVTQTEYAAIERKKPAPQQLEQSNNGTSAASAQAREVDVVYMRPQIIGPGANPSGEIVSDIRTDYAELKYR